MSPWQVSIERGGDGWAVYYEARLIVGGYQTPSEAWWAVSFLARGEAPAYVPNGAKLDWPPGDREREARTLVAPYAAGLKAAPR
jgi:hypothetical protein